MLLVLIFLLLSFCVFLEDFKPEYRTASYLFSVVVLSVFLFFKYGQGTDYMSYVYVIKSGNDAISDFLKEGVYTNRFEIGFSFLSFVSLSIFNLSTELSISVFSLVAFLPIAFFLKKYSIKPHFALLYYFSLFFLIYPYSGIRQGICVALFAYYVLPVLYKREYVKYYIGVTLLVLLHNSAILLFLLPLFLLFKFNKWTTFLYLFFSLIFGTILMPLLLSKLYLYFGAAGAIAQAYAEKEGSGLDILSLLVRMIIYVPIYLYYFKKNEYWDNFTQFMFRIYSISFVIYLLFSFNALLSSRFNIYFRIVEPVLLTNLVLVNGHYNVRLLKKAFIYSFCLAMYIKSVQAELFYGEYKESVKFYTMPYVSLFDKDEIFEYRTVKSEFYQYVD